MCASGYCKGNNGGLTKGVCFDRRNINESCDINNDCQNQKCGRLQAGTDALFCCPSNQIGTYAGYDYCYQMPAGNSCWSDGK